MRPPPRLDELRFMNRVTTLNRKQNRERLTICRIRSAEGDSYSAYFLSATDNARHWFDLDPLTTQYIINAFCKGDPLDEAA